MRVFPPGPQAPKHHRAGTHRLIPPEETLRRVRPLMAVMGITRIANITGLDRLGIPVVTVCRPNSRSLAVSQGKGLDLDAAKASGLMEAVETYHAEHITLPLLLASYQELRFSHPLVDVGGLPRLSVNDFQPSQRLLWIQGHELRGNTPVWLPFELVHTDYTLPLPSGSGAFFMSSNGLSSGNHLLEALSHGICEVVERDATTLWHLQTPEARRRTRLDLGTVEDPDCNAVLEKFDRAGVDVAVWETTSDVGLPAFLCMCAEREPEPFRPLYPTSGMGCHPTRQVALLRALTEAAQVRATLISGSRDDLSVARSYNVLQDPVLAQRVQALMREPEAERRFQDVPTFEGASFDEDVAWELERLGSVGLDQVVLVDLTKPAFQIPVARVVIPGLESLHDAPGYVPGRRARRLMEARLS
ncbi:YcaO-like family protein [Corallococcus macrosporus]|uniref:YcaO-like family protein n=1 Tax=Corallococcus macrosporus TaxID=35 RepID=A0ABS3D7B1_9BACT|nr:YcaO-like family protein [Corallococcus macrosporus]MBN8227553.1 YcaO-like family protein [Corallococcus macrosporus]